MMKNILLLLSLFAIATITKAQNEQTFEVADNPNRDTTVYTIVEQMPEFKGGEDALLKYLGNNIKYPTAARDCNCQGTVFVTFVVDQDGVVVSPRILRKPKCEGTIYIDKDNNVSTKKSRKARKVNCADTPNLMAKEAVRVITSMPKWKAGMQNGKPVRVQYNLPIKFTMR